MKMATKLGGLTRSPGFSGTWKCIKLCSSWRRQRHSPTLVPVALWVLALWSAISRTLFLTCCPGITKTSSGRSYSIASTASTCPVFTCSSANTGSRSDQRIMLSKLLLTACAHYAFRSASQTITGCSASPSCGVGTVFTIMSSWGSALCPSLTRRRSRHASSPSLPWSSFRRSTYPWTMVVHSVGEVFYRGTSLVSYFAWLQSLS